MSDHYTQLSFDYVAGQTVSAAEYDSLVRILDVQLEGALEAIGAGVASGLLAAAGTGLTVNVAAGKAVLDTQYGKVYAERANAETKAVTASTTSYLWLAATFTPDNPAAYDTRETGSAVLVATLTNTNPGDALLLATVVAGATSITSVTDNRPLLGNAGLVALQTALDVVEADVADHETRIAALEGGSGGGDVLYVAGATWEAGSAQTVEQAVDAKDAAVTAALEAEIAAIDTGSSATFVPWDLNADAGFQHLCHYVRRVDAYGYEEIPGALVIDEVCGEGSNGSSDYVDAASDW